MPAPAEGNPRAGTERSLPLPSAPSPLGRLDLDQKMFNNSINTHLQSLEKYNFFKDKIKRHTDSIKPQKIARSNSNRVMPFSVKNFHPHSEKGQEEKPLEKYRPKSLVRERNICMLA